MALGPDVAENQLSLETQEWLSSTEGLTSLTSSFRTALHRLYLRSGNFLGLQNKYAEKGINLYSLLRRDVIGVGFAVQRAPLRDFYDEKDYDDLPHKDAECHCYTFSVAVKPYSPSADCLAAIGGEDISLLAQFAAEDLLQSNEHIFLADKATSRCIPDPDGEREAWLTIDVLCGDETREQLRVVEGDDDIRSICGLTFSELERLIWEADPRVSEFKKHEFSRIPKKFEGLHLSRHEVVMASLLSDRGYVVFLEPSLILPQELSAARRQPDIVVCKDGRVLAIEIDDRSHLVYAKKGSSSERANVEKYKRDREFDRIMLANGIPLIRIYWEEFREHPSDIVSYIETVYHSLGGRRYGYS